MASVVLALTAFWVCCGAIAGAWMVAYVRRRLPKVYREHRGLWIGQACQQIPLGLIALVAALYYYGWKARESAGAGADAILGIGGGLALASIWIAGYLIVWQACA